MRVWVVMPGVEDLGLSRVRFEYEISLVHFLKIKAVF